MFLVLALDLLFYLIHILLPLWRQSDFSVCLNHLYCNCLVRVPSHLLVSWFLVCCWLLFLGLIWKMWGCIRQVLGCRLVCCLSGVRHRFWVVWEVLAGWSVFGGDGWGTVIARSGIARFNFFMSWVSHQGTFWAFGDGPSWRVPETSHRNLNIKLIPPK